jgi:hypothetical protein
MIERAIQKPKANVSRRSGKRRSAPHQEWTTQIPDNEWAIYERAISALRTTNRPFMLAGAFSLASYTGRWRNTKDIDFYVLPRDRGPMIEALTAAGFKDYYEKLPYVRHWIYRAYKDDCIVDIIWAHANQRAQVDEVWFENACEINVHGETLAVVPPEELLWCKLYVLQKDRCDWPDIFNLIHSLKGKLDWPHLLDRVGADLPLLAGLLTVYRWFCPGDEFELPEALRSVLSCRAPGNGKVLEQCRVDLLDTRPWLMPRKNIS